MRYLILFILLFLAIRLISYAYFNRPSVRGPRSTRQTQGRAGDKKKQGQNRFGSVEEAEFEEIEEPEKKEKR